AGEDNVAAVAGRDDMAAHRQAGDAEGGRGHAVGSTNAYWAAGIVAVNLELDCPGWCTGAGRRAVDGSGEGQRLPEYRPVGGGENTGGCVTIAEDVQPGC